MRNYNIKEGFIELCVSSMRDNERCNLSLFILIYVLYIITSTMVIFVTYLTPKCYILFLQDFSMPLSHMLVRIYII